MKPKSRLEDCPFCLSEQLRVTNCSSMFMDEQYCIECRDCGCQGPLAPTEEEARDCWNRRLTL